MYTTNCMPLECKNGMTCYFSNKRHLQEAIEYWMLVIRPYCAGWCR
jgi:hypothetical protein